MQYENNFSIDQIVRIILIAILTYWVFVLARPLIGLLTWSIVLAIALFPIYRWLNHRLGRHSNLAATLVVIISILFIVGTLMMLTNNMITTLSEVTAKIRANEFVVPDAPDSIKSLPLIGEDIHDTWSQASSNISEVIKKYSKFLVDASGYALRVIAQRSVDLLLFIIALILSGLILARHVSLMGYVRQFAKRISPNHGDQLISIVNETIRNVSIGVVGLSVLQSVCFGLLLLIGGVPGAGLASIIALLFCIAQIGLIILIIPAAIWLFATQSFAFSLIITVLLLILGLSDNVLKPLVFARGLNTPIIVIFTGVIGGILAHGLIGIFVGPVIMAVFYDIATQWLHANKRIHS